jgi:hypothetical protein
LHGNGFGRFFAGRNDGRPRHRQLRRKQWPDRSVITGSVQELFKAADPRVAQSSGTMIASAVVLTAVAGLAAIEVAAIASRLDACARPPIAPAVLARSC